MRQLLALFVCLLVAVAAVAQTSGTIRGVIVDRGEDEEAAPGLFPFQMCG